MSPAGRDAADPALRLGISACLHGAAVRYDGAHKRAAALLERFASHVHWVPVCPEVEAGLGVPRPPIRLELVPQGVRLMGIGDRVDHTQAMARCIRAWTSHAETQGLAGLVLKQRSPSCGPGDAPLHDAAGDIMEKQDGAFAAGIRKARPFLPIVGDEELATATQRESFLARAEAHAGFLSLQAGATTLPSFHRRHRSAIALRAPGLLAGLREHRKSGDVAAYGRAFFRGMQRVPELEDHVRVLRRLVGIVAERSPGAGDRETGSSVDAYREGAVDLATVVRAVAGAVQRGAVIGLVGDSYLEPGPLRLREYERM